MIDWSIWSTSEARDLAWLLSSDDIVDAGALLPADPVVLDAAARSDLTRVLDALDATPVADWLRDEPTIRRLGRYAERLLGAWLRRSGRYALLGEGVVLESERRTVGECDFLVQTSAGEREHWELAVKFYLRTAAGATEWRGADPRDCLSAKVATMRERQLRIHLRPEFVARFGTGWRTRALLRGWLFEPLSEGFLAEASRGADAMREFRSDAAVTPPLRSPHAWLHATDRAIARVDAAVRDVIWFRLPRRGWLRPHLGALPPESVRADRLAALASPASSSGGASMMAAALVPGPRGWHEVARLMVVRPGWPEISAEAGSSATGRKAQTRSANAPTQGASITSDSPL